MIKCLVPPPNLSYTVSVLSSKERDTEMKTNMQKGNGIYKGEKEVPPMDSRWGLMPQHRRRQVGRWYSNHRMLNRSLHTKGGSQPRQSRPHYQKKRGMGTCYRKWKVEWVGSSAYAKAAQQ